MDDEVGAALLSEAHQALDALGQMNVVIVEVGDEGALGQIEGMVHRYRSRHPPLPPHLLRIAAPLGQVDEMQAAVANFGHAAGGIVGAAVADDDHLKLAIALPEEGRDRPLDQQVGAVICADANRDQRLGLVKHRLIRRRFPRGLKIVESRASELQVRAQHVELRLDGTQAVGVSVGIAQRAENSCQSSTRHPATSHSHAETSRRWRLIGRE